MFQETNKKINFLSSMWFTCAQLYALIMAQRESTTHNVGVQTFILLNR